jgi:hypothetical protein
MTHKLADHPSHRRNNRAATVTAALAVGVLVAGGGVAGSADPTGSNPERVGDRGGSFAASASVPVLASSATWLGERHDAALAPLVVLGLVASGGGVNGPTAGPAGPATVRGAA